MACCQVMGKYWWILLQLSFLRVFCLQNELLCYVLSFNLFSYPVISDSLRPYGLQHARLPCPSPSPGACSNSSIESVMPSNHLILCSPFSCCLQSFQASGCFPMIHQSIGVSASIEYSELISFRMDWMDLLAVQGTLNNTTVQKHQFFGAQLSL